MVIDTIMAKQQHMRDTLAEYGRAVVREMRALAVERDASTTNTVTGSSEAGDSGSTGTAASVEGTDRMVDTTVNANAASKAQKKGKNKDKAKNSKNRLAHVVDKMLFNYRNIGELPFYVLSTRRPSRL